MNRLVILVDDHAATNLIHQRLILNSYKDENLSIFESGRKACDFIENQIADMSNYDELLVLLDMKMPDIDGFEILDLLEENELDFSDKIKVYILTNDHSMRLQEKSSRYKYVKDVFRKPLNAASLEVIMN